MITTGKHLPRRAFLRGVGATVALPLLDSMVPAFTALAQTPAQPPRRLGVVYVPHGAVMNKWTPATTGSNFELTPILQPLAPFRDRFLVLSGLDNEPASARKGDPAGGHGRIGGAFLTGVHAKPTEGADVRAATSLDQIAAAHLRDETQLASLQLALEATDLAGACDVGFSCSYVNTLSWSSPTTPLPTQNNPRAVFERLFGDSDTTDSAARLERIQEDRSILDSVGDKVSALERRLGSGDRTKLSEYLEALRDVERRIQIAESQSDRELPVVERPSGGIPPTFEEHARLMIDLQVLAYQSDLTRVITFMISKELSNRTYPEIEVPDPHHPLSHHIGDPHKLEKLARLQTFHMQQFAYYLERLAATPDGDGSLLDNVMLLYGSGMSDSNTHMNLDLPILLAGGGGGQISGGRHLRFAPGTPLANLYLTLLDKMGVPAESIGDSNGRIEHVSIG
ncbi:MAG: DUF1552 domain-containing protein [Acidobacteriota bacterium]|nr:DUF1552 domain-containing protein [Acidobacteriota bacterium]